AMFDGVFLVPLFLQTVMGLSPVETGLLLLPASLATGIIMPVSGALFDRFGARPLVVLGMAVATFTTLQFHKLSLVTPLATIMLWYMYRGLGMGLTMMPATTAGLNTVELDKVSRATAITNTIRQVSSSFGIAVFNTLLQRRLVFHAADLASSLNAGNPTVHAALAKLGAPLAWRLLSGVVQQQAFVQAIDDVFWVATWFTVSGAILGLFLRSNGKERPAKGQSAMAAEI
ncbi:MAG: MFS transporter, partial [Firmicutes bacterium]|nr:MFS transporter [Bacillota bacterium]